MGNTPNPKVSIVVPNYNHARFLAQRLGGILAQTFQDFELILLDDCSTDESRSILSKYADNPRVRIEFNEVNSGSTFKQWNKGVRLAHGEYVWFAESDDYADEKLLERLVAVLDAEPQVVFVNCRSWRLDADDRVDGYADAYLLDFDREKWTNDFNLDGREECRNDFVYLNPVFNASSVLFRKAVYERVGGADESLRFCGDCSGYSHWRHYHSIHRRPLEDLCAIYHSASGSRRIYFGYRLLRRNRKSPRRNLWRSRLTILKDAYL